MDIPPITGAMVLGNVERLRDARVLAITSDGAFGLAIACGEQGLVELDVQAWRFAGERWWLRVSQFVEGPDSQDERWSGGSKGIFTEDLLGAYRNYGYAPACASVELTFDARRYRTSVLANGFWAFITDEESSTADPIIELMR
jgi:hypothetical protein